MNSLEPACSFAKVTPVPFYKFKQHIEPLFRFQVRVELIVGRLRLVKPAEYPDDSIHALNSSTLADVLITKAARWDRPVR